MSSMEKGPKWKNESVRGHSFDYLDMDDFYDPSCMTRLSYLFIYVIVIKSILVYVADAYSAVSLLVLGHSSTSTIDPVIPTHISKWIFLGCVIVSFLLLIWDMYKSKKIIRSRDIALVFTSVQANRYYSMKDYRYHSLFTRINKSRKRIDSYAFFIFFTLKGWKRLMLAEAPRQIINIVTLQALVPNWIQIDKGGVSLDNTALGHSWVQQLMTISMAFSVLVFAISFFLVAIAGCMYVPLLCHIRGNLKEYVCHKVDKRIEDLLQKHIHRRQMGLTVRHKKRPVKRAGTMAGLKPTLPNIDVEDEPANTPFLSHAYRHGGGYYDDQHSDYISLTSHAQPLGYATPPMRHATPPNGSPYQHYTRHPAPPPPPPQHYYHQGY
ncbi:hypothetical protein DM01DRAFT_1322594 [Hesseltinella vesiculosa]|uniref:Vacuolar membrane protein n=1 Tax=Hesseltinella vesiculosa TaxID=101127 RepID=A0A1X2GH72_9FUNG|nr:hypothetical protein DM01DRAFT_1322594 [Hesseltinella vesiculosa]